MIDNNIKKIIIDSFEEKCLLVLIDGYFLSVSEKKCNCEWKEKTFSSHLVKHMKNSSLALKYGMVITKEDELDDIEIDDGLKDPDKANPIDISIHQIYEYKVFKYCVEAKNISFSNWIKSNGKKVSGWQQKKDYISEGVDRFILGHYMNQNGCMVAYVVNGNIFKVLKAINEKLIQLKRNSEKIIKFKKLNGFSLYESKHSNRKLKHLFFDFTIKNSVRD
ncbi:MAG: hypothetical protein J0M18_11600 [Ignavibacteria bacterium]|nr:hypothetical protein [Ignavibacteria bacterium]